MYAGQDLAICKAATERTWRRPLLLRESRNMRGKVLVLWAGVLSLLSLGNQLEASLFVTGNIPTSGLQSWTGPLGDDFTVGNADLAVSRIGVFDAGQNGLHASITAYIYNLGGGTPILTVVFPNPTAAMVPPTFGKMLR